MFAIYVLMLMLTPPAVVSLIVYLQDIQVAKYTLCDI